MAGGGFDLTLVIENADQMDQWFTVGRMLAGVISLKRDQHLRLCILPRKMPGKRTLSRTGCPALSPSRERWVYLLGYMLHSFLPIPYYPEISPGSEDSIYDMAFVALNADQCQWYIMLDLCEQDGVKESEDYEPLQKLLVSNLGDIMCDNTPDAAAPQACGAAQ